MSFFVVKITDPAGEPAVLAHTSVSIDFDDANGKTLATFSFTRQNTGTKWIPLLTSTANLTRKDLKKKVVFDSDGTIGTIRVDGNEIAASAVEIDVWFH